MTTQPRARVPAGVPAGGRFATTAREQAEVRLSPPEHTKPAGQAGQAGQDARSGRSERPLVDHTTLAARMRIDLPTAVTARVQRDAIDWDPADGPGSTAKRAREVLRSAERTIAEAHRRGQPTPPGTRLPFVIAAAAPGQRERMYREITLHACLVADEHDQTRLIITFPDE